MAVQVSWPGVYVDEFTPGAPIQGVGTSTPVFLGIAEKGPRNTATRIGSWDEFGAKFGGFLSDAGGWLAQGVYGFFANGGTNCYVVRVSSAATATADLPARGGGNSLTATAIAEGPEGNGIRLAVTESSRSAAAVERAMTRTITAVGADHKTLTLTGGSIDDISVDAEVVIVRGNLSVTDAVVASKTAPDQVELVDELPHDQQQDFTGGSARFGYPVRVLVENHSVTAVSADRTKVTVDTDSHRFAPGDAVRIAKAANHVDTFVTEVNGDVITVGPPLGGAVDFSDGTLRSADLAQHARRLRLLTPAGMSVSAGFPPGSLLQVTPDGGAAVYVRVTASGGDAVELDAPGLPAAIPLTTLQDAPTVATADFDVAVHTPTASAPETFAHLSMDPRSPGYWGKAAVSGAVTLGPDDPPGTADGAGDDRPAVGVATTGGGTSDNFATSWQSLTTTPNQYLAPLARLRDVSLIAVPGGTEAALQQALIAHCEQLKDRFAVLDAAPRLDITGVANQFGQVRSTKGYAALYYPWIQVREPATGELQSWPPSGHILGVYARTDAERGVHKAPANTTIRGALGLERALSDSEQGPLNLMGVNVSRVFPGQSQPVVWGGRTTAGDLDTNWLYVNVRRLFIYLEQSLERGIRWAVFEPNDLALWQKLKRSISDFLTQTWRDGALFGAKPEEAFYVRIDEALNPPSTRALGRLYIEVGVVPTYPAEFIVLRIGIWDGGSDVTTS